MWDGLVHDWNMYLLLNLLKNVQRSEFALNIQVQIFGLHFELQVSWNTLVSSKVFGLPYSYTPVVCAQACVLKCSWHPLWTRTLCSDFSWEKVVPMRVLKWKFPSRGFNSRLWEMDLFLKTRVTVLKTTRRTMVGSWQCLGPRERVLLILKLIPKCHLGCGVLGLGVRTCPNVISSTTGAPRQIWARQGPIFYPKIFDLLFLIRSVWRPCY